MQMALALLPPSTPRSRLQTAPLTRPCRKSSRAGHSDSERWDLTGSLMTAQGERTGARLCCFLAGGLGPGGPPSLRSLSDHRGRGVTSNRLTLPLCWMSQTRQEGLEKACSQGWGATQVWPPLWSLPHSPHPWGLE